MKKANLAASVRARLLNRARADKADFMHVLTRFALERLLYRLSISAHREQFLLKGALLFELWFEVPHRPTRDIDLLGFGSANEQSLSAVFQDLCALSIEDGMYFDASAIKLKAIRKDSNYSGMRVTLTGTLDNARCSVQVDIGFGDIVTPGAETVVYPRLLNDLPAPQLRAYPRYSVVAEKLEALVALGMANSRLKDYFDLWILAEHSHFDGALLQRAVQATFQRRQTRLPDNVPFGLTAAFSTDSTKQSQWRAFLGKNKLQAIDLDELVRYLALFLTPVLDATANEQNFTDQWPPGGPWSD